MLSHHSITLLLSLSTLLTLTILPIAPAYADSDYTDIVLFCKQAETKSGLTPITFIQSEYQSRPYSRIAWDEILGGQNPLERCQQATKALQEAVDKYGSKFAIIENVINGQKVICATDNYDKGCQIIIFSLEPHENAQEILETFKNRLVGRAV